MTNSGFSNVVPFVLLDRAHSQQHQSIAAAKMSSKARALQVAERDEDYRYRIFASVLVAGFVGMLVMSGQWMFTILARMP